MYSNLETPPPDEMTIGKVLGDATSGTLYNYGHNELWVSFDEGVSWTFRENYSYSGKYTSGGINGEIYKNGTDVAGTLYFSDDYGTNFIINNINIKFNIEVGTEPGEFYGRSGQADIGYSVEYSYDYGVNFLTIPIDSSIAYWSIGGHYPQISRGTEPGELYLVSWWPDYHYKIFHSVDTGYTWTQQYESDSISIYYWGVQYTAGREPGSFYVKRTRFAPTLTHTEVYIDYSTDYGQTFTTYFHDLVPDFTSVNSIEKPNISHSNYPNPFSNHTTFQFQLPAHANNPQLNIYDMNGKRIRQFEVNGKKEQSWDGTDSNGKPSFAGIYLYNITYDNTSTALQKAIILY
jgi:hypothetical protein